MQRTVSPGQLPLGTRRHFYVYRRRKKLLLALIPMPVFDGSEPCNGDDAFTHDTLTDGPQDRAEIQEMRKTCARCPKQEACAEYAIAHERYFFWGGLTERERKAIRVERGQAYIDPLHSRSAWDTP